MGRIQYGIFFEKPIESVLSRVEGMEERIGSHGSMSLPDLITQDYAGFVSCTSDVVPEICDNDISVMALLVIYLTAVSSRRSLVIS